VESQDLNQGLRNTFLLREEEGMPSRRKERHPLREELRKYRLELAALILILLGVFLVLEPFEIRATLRHWLGLASQDLLNLADAGIALIQRLSLSDLIGLILLVPALVFIAWRVRYRLLDSDWLVVDACPRCGNPVRRVHRRFLDRLVGLILQIRLRRYRCMEANCGWSGLRRHSYGSQHSHSTADEAV
jgi:hypothetical protein